tara:strand:- start:3851 stop:5032 length:1182 start_codon:yes stop_codon:yes gene_type:complete
MSAIGWLKYDDYAREQRRYKEKVNLLQREMDLKEKRLDLDERTLDFNINSQKDKVIIDTLKILNKGGSGTALSGALGLTGTSSSKKTMTNARAAKILQDRWGIKEGTIFKLLGNTQTQDNVGQLIIDELEKSYKVYTDSNYPNIPKEEIGRMLEEVVESASLEKPYEGLFDRISSMTGGEISDTMQQVLQGFEETIRMNVDVGGIGIPDKPMFKTTDITTMESSIDTSLQQRLAQEKERLQRALNSLTAAGTSDVINKELYLILSNRLKEVNTLITGKSAGQNRSFYGTNNQVDELMNTQFQNTYFPPNAIPKSFRTADKFFTLPSKVPAEFIPDSSLVGAGGQMISPSAQYQKKIMEKLKELNYLNTYDDGNPFNYFSRINIEGQPGPIRVD